MQLVILAAGMGSRFGGLKQVEPMDNYGNFLLDYSVYDAKRAGFDSVIFIIKKENENLFKSTIGKRIEKLIKVDYAYQELNDIPEGFKVPEGRDKPWGTGHALYAARNLIKEDFIMINGDDFYGRNAFEIAANYIKSLPNGSVGKYANVVYKVSNTMTENGSVKRGVCFELESHELDKLIESQIVKDEDGSIVCTPIEGGTSFIVSEDQPVSMNLFIFNKDLITHLVEKLPLWLEKNINKPKAEFLIPSVVDELVQEGKATMKLLLTDSKWYGVTYKEDKPEVVKGLKELVKKGEYKEGLY